MNNPAISVLRKKMEDYRDGLRRSVRAAEENEALAKKYRGDEAAYLSVIKQTERAIKQIEAAERQIALYGRVVTQ